MIFVNWSGVTHWKALIARTARQRLLTLGCVLGLGISALALSGCGGGSDTSPPPDLVVTQDLVEPITQANVALLQGTVFSLPAGAFSEITPEATTLSFSIIKGATVAPGATEATLELGTPTFTLETGGANPRTITGNLRFGSCILDFPMGISITMNPCAFKLDSAGKRVGTENFASISNEFTVTKPNGQQLTYRGQGKPISGFFLTWVTDANGVSTVKLSYQHGKCSAPDGGCAPLNGSSNIALPNFNLLTVRSKVKVTVIPISGGGN